jgi:hypothetical protein
MKNLPSTTLSALYLDWKIAFGRYRDLLSPRLLIRAYPPHRPRLQGLLDAGLRSRSCCLGYIRTH